ncbi:migration and invasion-inhibitory protein isoform X3 [Urocitellus parryii]
MMEDMPRMMETEDLLQLRLLSLKLLRQLQAGQDAVQRSVAKTAPKSGLNSCNIYDSETPLSPETSSISWQASCSKDRCHKWDPLDTHGDDPCDVAWLDRVSPRVAFQPPVKGQHLEPLGQPRFHSLTTRDSKEPAPLSGLCDRVPRSILAEQSEQSKSRVTCQEPATPESSWSLQPYLGYDWIVGSMDSSSSITSKPETFFSTLQKFRETNKEECVYSTPEPQFLGLCDGGDVEEDHECECPRPGCCRVRLSWPHPNSRPLSSWELREGNPGPVLVCTVTVSTSACFWCPWILASPAACAGDHGTLRALGPWWSPLGSG